MSSAVVTTSFWRGHLPHWQVAGGRYFVTLRLAGSLPRAVSLRLRGELAAAKGPTRSTIQRRIFREIETWLDRVDPACNQLADPRIAKLVTDAIDGHAARGWWTMHTYVIMPSHLHLFFSLQRAGLSETLTPFKRYTARKANRILNRTGGKFWQEEWFDHWSRSGIEDSRIRSYIRQNPVRAGLVSAPDAWPYKKE